MDVGGYFGCSASANAMIRGGAWGYGGNSGVLFADFLESPTLARIHNGR
jgi:hypothetical protein